MKLPIFTTVVLFSLFIWIYMKYSSRKADSEDEKFWDREREANSTRKQPLTNLNYISIPFEELPFDDSEDEDIRSAQDEISALKDAKIVNFNGRSNTDLKLEYGVANLTTLSEFDQNYTTLVTALAKWGEALYKNNRIEDTEKVMNFALDCKSDIRSCYTILADIYKERKDYDKIEELIARAEELHSLTRNALIRDLKERSIFSPSYK